MSKEFVYTGHRDPRFVTIHRGGMLEDGNHRLLNAWAAACAEHVLDYFSAQHPHEDRSRLAIEAACAWSPGEISMTQARQAAVAAHAATTAHMADHELGAAVYAIRVVRAASPLDQRDEAGRKERRQREQLPSAVRVLVRSNQKTSQPQVMVSVRGLKMRWMEIT